MGLHYLGTKSAMGVLHNSLEQQLLEAPRFHPNTREAVINRLIGWINGDFDFDAFILWLHVAAGAGKSAIAHTLAEICKQHGWLLVTFSLEDSGRTQQCRAICRHNNLPNCSCDSHLALAC